MINKMTMDWSVITPISIIIFLAGWLMFGLFDAVLISILVLALMGIVKFR